MATNYGVSPTWLAAPPTDVLGTEIRGVEMGDRLAAQRLARQAALEASFERSREFDQEMQARAQDSQAQRELQQQQLAISGMKAATEARQASAEMDAQAAIQREFQSLGHPPTPAEAAGIISKYPIAWNSGMAGLLRGFQTQNFQAPEMVSLDNNGTPVSAVFNPRTGSFSIVKNQPPKLSPQDAEELSVIRQELGAAYRNLLSVQRNPNTTQEMLDAARKSYDAVLKKRNDFQQKLKGQPEGSKSEDSKDNTTESDPLGLFK
ncbi:MAG: hypothetical protein KGJ13_09550 [Patescibacteria group bacterium]|nr:hypothetical protein [Patescibacteria group bacterium]